MAIKYYTHRNDKKHNSATVLANASGSLLYIYFPTYYPLIDDLTSKCKAQFCKRANVRKDGLMPWVVSWEFGPAVKLILNEHLGVRNVTWSANALQVLNNHISKAA